MSSLDEAKNELQDIQNDEMDALDAMPDSLQESSPGKKMQEWVDFMEDVLTDIDHIVDKIERKMK